MGLVPYDLVARMTPEEWQRIQVVDRTSATEMLTLSRTTTPEMDPAQLEELLLVEQGEEN